MIKISKQDDNFLFDIQGMHKLWTFKSQLKIPVEHIIKAHQDFYSVSAWKGWKRSGTNIPFLISAGTFHLNGDTIFWDVMNKEKSIIVELVDEEYKQLVIEVENPNEAIELLNSK